MYIRIIPKAYETKKLAVELLLYHFKLLLFFAASAIISFFAIPRMDAL